MVEYGFGFDRRENGAVPYRAYGWSFSAHNSAAEFLYEFMYNPL